MTEKQFRVFKFPDVDKFGVSDDIAEVTVAFCDKKWEADYLCDLLNNLTDENKMLKKANQELYDKLQETMSAYSLKRGEVELIKHIIRDAYNNERTQIGKNVLKQLLDNLR